jgi:hypothetical protein
MVRLRLVALRRSRSIRSLSPKGWVQRALPRRPVLDHLVELLERKQPPVPAFVPGLAAGEGCQKPGSSAES